MIILLKSLIFEKAICQKLKTKKNYIKNKLKNIYSKKSGIKSGEKMQKISKNVEKKFILRRNSLTMYFLGSSAHWEI